MQNLLKGMIICVAVLIILTAASASYAQDMGKKLQRGAANFFTGWMEIPNNVRDITAQENILSGIFIGIPKGCCMTIIRTGAGIYEILTFPFPIPDGYNPMLEPEFVFKGK